MSLSVVKRAALAWAVATAAVAVGASACAGGDEPEPDPTAIAQAGEAALQEVLETLDGGGTFTFEAEEYARDRFPDDLELPESPLAPPEWLQHDRLISRTTVVVDDDGVVVESWGEIVDADGGLIASVTHPEDGETGLTWTTPDGETWSTEFGGGWTGVSFAPFLEAAFTGPAAVAEDPEFSLARTSTLRGRDSVVFENADRTRVYEIAIDNPFYSRLSSYEAIDGERTLVRENGYRDYAVEPAD